MRLDFASCEETSQFWNNDIFFQLDLIVSLSRLPSYVNRILNLISVELSLFGGSLGFLFLPKACLVNPVGARRKFSVRLL